MSSKLCKIAGNRRKIIIKKVLSIWSEWSRQTKKLNRIEDSVASKHQLLRKRLLYDNIYQFHQNSKNRRELKKVASYYFIAKIIRRTLTILGDHAKEQKASRFLRGHLLVKSLASLQQFTQ